MSAGVLLLNFGEPSEPDRDVVVEYLQRIFLANASLEGASSAAEAEPRARELAERRVDGLIDEYREIGGSPLNPQSRAQAAALEQSLADRGFDVATYVGMQFVEPFIPAAVQTAIDEGVDRLVGLPVYPLCGPSTTVAALEEMRSAVTEAEWDGPIDEITGWHRHPTYNRLRAETITAFVDDAGVDLRDPGTELVFSAHGTPRHYLEEGSQYQRYVEEYCAAQAALVGVEEYTIGYQNHENRDIPWTEPAVEQVIDSIDAERVVVDPVSFIHEQSETLSELDIELRAEAEARGLDFYRVGVPHNDDRFPALLADLIEPFLAEIDPRYYNLRPCRCRPDPAAVCLNAGVGDNR